MTSSKRASAKVIVADQEVQTLHGNYNERELLLRCNALNSNERQIFYSKIPLNKQTDQYKNYGRIRQRTQAELIYKMDINNLHSFHYCTH